MRLTGENPNRARLARRPAKPIVRVAGLRKDYDLRMSRVALRQDADGRKRLSLVRLGAWPAKSFQVTLKTPNRLVGVDVVAYPIEGRSKT